MACERKAVVFAFYSALKKPTEVNAYDEFKKIMFMHIWRKRNAFEDEKVFVAKLIDYTARVLAVLADPSGTAFKENV